MKCVETDHKLLGSDLVERLVQKLFTAIKIGIQDVTDRLASDMVSAESVRFTEPRLMFLAKVLGVFQSDHFASQQGAIRAFSIKPDVWTTFRGSLMDNLGSLSSTCDSSCSGCYLKGNPSYLPGHGMSLKEAYVRIQLYEQNTGKGLAPFHREYAEPLTNPHFLDILRAVRNKSTEVLNFLTNGNRLEKHLIDELAKLKPITVGVSLNCSNPATRARIMGNPSGARVAIASLKWLREAQITFSGSVVAWPELELDELEETVRFICNYDPLCVRVVLPGFTRYSPRPDESTWEQHWTAVAKVIRKLRTSLPHYIELQPHAYWIRSMKAVIDGIIPGSPAAESGLRAGDRILSVDGNELYGREAARHLIRRSIMNGSEHVTVSVSRGSKRIDLTVRDSGEASYPYRPEGYPTDPSYLLGICLVESFRPQYLKSVERLISEQGVKRVLVFTSPLMKSQVRESLRMLPEGSQWSRDVRVKFVVCRNEFWGGNIMLGDLMTVGDYIRQVQSLADWRPELVIIPSSGFTNGRDYLGRPYTDIQQAANVPVRIVPTVRIMV